MSHPPELPVILRLEVDYAPWRTDADHTIPARLLNLLERALRHGYRLHAFLSLATIHALPSSVIALAGEGHDVDYLDLSGRSDDCQEAVMRMLELRTPVQMVLSRNAGFLCPPTLKLALVNPPGCRILNPLHLDFHFRNLGAQKGPIVSQRSIG